MVTCWKVTPTRAAADRPPSTQTHTSIERRWTTQLPLVDLARLQSGPSRSAAVSHSFTLSPLLWCASFLSNHLSSCASLAAGPSQAYRRLIKALLIVCHVEMLLSVIYHQCMLRVASHLLLPTETVVEVLKMGDKVWPAGDSDSRTRIANGLGPWAGQRQGQGPGRHLLGETQPHSSVCSRSSFLCRLPWLPLAL